MGVYHSFPHALPLTSWSQTLVKRAAEFMVVVQLQNMLKNQDVP